MKKKKLNNLLYQIRIDLEEDLAQDIRENKNNEIISRLNLVLENNKASLVCQFDAFNNFLKECENEGDIDNPLYKWTKDTVENKTKKEKYLKSFTIYIENNQLYPKAKADKIKSEIGLLNNKKILNINEYNSDPKNNPQPPSKYF